MIKFKKILLIFLPIIMVFVLSFKNASYAYKTEDLKNKILPALNREYTLVNLECPDDE